MECLNLGKMVVYTIKWINLKSWRDALQVKNTLAALTEDPGSVARKHTEAPNHF